MFDFSKIQFKDIEGNPLIIDRIEKTVGDALFKHAVSFPMHEISGKIYKGENFDITASEIEELIPLVDSVIRVIYLKQPIITYLKQLQNEFTTNQPHN